MYVSNCCLRAKMVVSCCGREVKRGFLELGELKEKERVPQTRRVEGKGGRREPKLRVREGETRGVRPSKEEGEVSRLCSCHG